MPCSVLGQEPTDIPKDTDLIFPGRRNPPRIIEISGKACSQDSTLRPSKLLTLGHSDRGHPIKVGWREIIREHIRTL